MQAVRKDTDKEFGWQARPRKAAATFGLPQGSCKPHTPNYLRRRAGEVKLSDLKTNGDYPVLTNGEDIRTEARVSEQ